MSDRLTKAEGMLKDLAQCVSQGTQDQKVAIRTLLQAVLSSVSQPLVPQAQSPQFGSNQGAPSAKRQSCDRAEDGMQVEGEQEHKAAQRSRIHTNTLPRKIRRYAHSQCGYL